MKKTIHLLLLVVMLFGLAACSQPESENQATEPIELTDALGKPLTLESLPQSIVVAGKQTPMIIDLIYLFPSAEAKIVGIENRSQTTTSFLDAFSPSSSLKVNLEKGAGAEQIAALNPDLVILKTTMAEEVGAGLETLGIPILYVSMESISEIETDITNIGIVLGDSERAAEIIDQYGQIRSDIEGKIPASEEAEPEVLLLQYSEDNGEIAFEVPPVSWLQTNLVEMAGGNPIWKEAVESGGWTKVNMEQIADWNPEMIFVVNYSGDSESTVSQLLENSTWQELDAAKNGKIYGFPGDFISWDQPDSRWILGFYWLAVKINPEDFQDVDFTVVVTDFYKTFYSLDESTIQQNILPLLFGSL